MISYIYQNNSHSNSHSNTDSNSIIHSDNKSNRAFDPISMYSATAATSIISDDDDEVKDTKEQKRHNKRFKRPDTSISPKPKRRCLPSKSLICPEIFRSSETFDSPEFIEWLQFNQHLRTIKGGTSKIYELLDKVRIENPALNQIFLAFTENNEQVNPYFFDIVRLVRPNDVLIHPPHWKSRTDSGGTYVWTFDIPVKDLESYCKEIEKDISDNPHCSTQTEDHRPYVLTQFRSYLEKELPLHKKPRV
jgi:hypothetical protein